MRVSESLARDVLRLVVWYPLRLCLERLPPRTGFAVLAALGRFHAALAGRLGGRAARIARAAGRVAPHLDAAGRQAQMVAAYETHYVNQLSIFVFPKLTRATLPRVLEIEGLGHLHTALAAGRGVVLPIGHFGPTQLPLTALGLLGHPMLQIGFANAAGLSFIGRHVAFRLRLRYEARIPATIVPPGPGTRRALAHLKTGGIVMTTADDGPGQPAFGHHGDFDFPGGRLHAPLGPARLALAADAALCPAFLTPGENAPFRLTIEAPLEIPGLSDKNAAATALTAAFLRRYAMRVTAMPGWWHSLESQQFPRPTQDVCTQPPV